MERPAQRSSAERACTTRGVISVAHRIVPDPRELRDIHAATCRPRRQGLACSTCSELLERLISALRAATAEAA
jgi:hypothetical protein